MLNALHWYLSNYRTMLSRYDYKLASRFTAEDLGTMTMRTKRQWIHHLDVARTAYDLEKATVAPGQQLLTKYFSFRGLAPQLSLSSSLSPGCVSRGTYSIINHSAQDTVHICAGECNRFVLGHKMYLKFSIISLHSSSSIESIV